MAYNPKLQTNWEQQHREFGILVSFVHIDYFDRIKLPYHVHYEAIDFRFQDYSAKKLRTQPQSPFPVPEKLFKV